MVSTHENKQPMNKENLKVFWKKISGITVYHGRSSLHDQHRIYPFEVTSTKKAINYCLVARN